MILVTAGFGNQGKLLVPKLLAAGQQVRACVQSKSSAESLRALGVQDVVVGDISEPATMHARRARRRQGLSRRADRASARTRHGIRHR